MLDFPRWKIWAVILTLLIGCLYAVPSFLPERIATQLPKVFQAKVNLGLDLAGGSYLLLEAQTSDVAKARIALMEDQIRTELRKSDGRIAIGEMSTRDNKLTFMVREPSQVDAAVERIRPLTQGAGMTGQRDFNVEVRDGNTIVVTPTDAGIAKSVEDAMTVATEVIRKRIDEMGTREPTVIREGASRIVVQVPGLQDPSALKALLGQTAKLEFKLVDTTANPVDLAKGIAPIGSEVVPYPNNPAGGPVIAVKRQVMVSGDELTDARQAYEPKTNAPVVTITFNRSGANKFARTTQANVGKPFAMILDGKVLSAPNINEPILGGSAQISGNFTVESANQLAISLRSGKLPVALKVVQESTVSPELGADSIKAGITASILAVVAVALFMFATYGRWGFYANLAVTINVLVILGVMGLLNATLTLPGIAGFVLTIGTAVDANVLIYERIREELRRGRSVVQAIEFGYKEASRTIFEANVTHAIAGGIMLVLGSGPIKGFAIVLLIGIATSVFTAVTFTRLLATRWLRAKRPTQIKMGPLRIVPDNTNIGFVRIRHIAFIVTALLTIGAIGLTFARGLNLGVDFVGGVSIEEKFASPPPIDEVRSTVNGLGLGEASLQQLADKNIVSIRLPLPDTADEGATDRVVEKVKTALAAKFPGAKFSNYSTVSGKVSGELVQNGMLAVALAIVGIAIFSWFRYEWQFGVSTAVAIVHDVLMTVGFFALTQLAFDLNIVAAVLTIIGYSINDKMVIDDRIRENMRKYRKMDMKALIDLSVNETLPRTVMTSFTIMLALGALLIFGGHVLRGFTAAMMLGIVVGTYSSVYVSSSLLITLGLKPNPTDRKVTTGLASNAERVGPRNEG
ncbi:protein translocase subunit SecD [Sphingobium nicotianae]|uniref:Multifunctional fusion protein n=1 Tax=Sphingobium nicotianae TaxID=2782607 RepID=A0A9X1DCW3_9SPHN|nr:protein translocase subunit SecD [Sphingobium nicotianae]MBT2187569.1 protein translocase subunit SecD [Sphingobium nicotianae]